MKQKSLFTESTEVPVSKSVGEITGLLVGSGASNINSEYEGGKIVGFSFTLRVGQNVLEYKLPVRVTPVEKIFNGRRDKSRQFPAGWRERDRDQAERVAWRQLYWWLKSNLALIDLKMVAPPEVFLPYMIGKDGRTLYEGWAPKLLESPKAESGGAQ